MAKIKTPFLLFVLILATEFGSLQANPQDPPAEGGDPPAEPPADPPAEPPAEPPAAEGGGGAAPAGPPPPPPSSAKRVYQPLPPPPPAKVIDLDAPTSSRPEISDLLKDQFQERLILCRVFFGDCYNTFKSKKSHLQDTVRQSMCLKRTRFHQICDDFDEGEIPAAINEAHEREQQYLEEKRKKEEWDKKTFKNVKKTKCCG